MSGCVSFKTRSQNSAMKPKKDSFQWKRSYNKTYKTSPSHSMAISCKTLEALAQRSRIKKAEIKWITCKTRNDISSIVTYESVDDRDERGNSRTLREKKKKEKKKEE